MEKLSDSFRETPKKKTEWQIHFEKHCTKCCRELPILRVIWLYNERDKDAQIGWYKACGKCLAPLDDFVVNPRLPENIRKLVTPEFLRKIYLSKYETVMFKGNTLITEIDLKRDFQKPVSPDIQAVIKNQASQKISPVVKEDEDDIPLPF